MPAPPFNLATMASNSQEKLLGGNIGQVPIFVTGAPNTSYQYGWILQNFTSGQNTRANHVLPSLKNIKRRGKHVRCIIAGDYVLLGLMTNAEHNTAVNLFLSDVRALGMTCSLALMATGDYAAIGSPSAAAIWAVAKSVLDNCIATYQDIVVYFEPCNQEPPSTDIAINNAVCGLMKGAGYTCPIGVSNVPTVLGGDFSGYTADNIDVMGLHLYPQVGGFAPNFANAQNGLYTTLTSQHKPVFIEETGWTGDSTAYQAKADWLENLLYATYGDPNVIGVNWWSGQGSAGVPGGIVLNGDWSFILCPPPENPNAYNPGTDWQDTITSRVFVAHGSANRKLVFPWTLHASQAITTTPTAIVTDGTTPIQHSPLPSMAVGRKIWDVGSTCSLVGPATITGDVGTTYTITLNMHNFVLSTDTVIGSASRVGSGTIDLNISGNMPLGDFTVQVLVSRGAGVDGTIIAFAATFTLGNAPALNSPVATPIVL